MNTWLVSDESGSREVTPLKVRMHRNGAASLLLSLEVPGSPGILSEPLWSLSGPGIPRNALFRTLSTRRSTDPGLMVLTGVPVLDENRSNENNTIRLLRSLLDLDVYDAPLADTTPRGGSVPPEVEPVRGLGAPGRVRVNGSCA